MNNSKKNANKTLDMSEQENKTYELCYNSACLSISRGNYDEAESKLKKAEGLLMDWKLFFF